MSSTEACIKLKRFGVATVYEASGRKGLVDIPLIQTVPGSAVAGTAVTVACGQNDNLMVHAAMEQVHPGDVLVITMPESAPIALIGELLVTQAMKRGAAGILIDAAVRDVEEIRELGFPVWSRYIRVRGATKKSIGTINKPLEIGGNSVKPGDYVVMDVDGAVIVDQEDLQEVIKASEAREEKEKNMRKKLNEGQLSYDIHGLRDYVEENK